MTVDVEAAPSAGLLSRIRNLILKPQAAWDAIAAEPAGDPYVNYALPLAVLGAVAHIVGYSFLGGYDNKPLLQNAVVAAFDLIGALGSLYLTARVANVLAPRFGSEKDEAGAHKLIAYSATALLLGGLFAIWPPIASFAIAGLYSLVLLWIGLPRLLKTPEDRRFGYTATIVVVWIVASLVVGMGVHAASGAVVKLLPAGEAPAPVQTQTETSASSGGAALDLAALMRAARAAQVGDVRPLDPARLQNLLPQTLPGGFALTAASSTADGGAQAEGEYANGAQRIVLRIAQTGRVGEIAPAASYARSYEGQDGYARTNAVDGRLYGESMNSASGAASFVIVGYGLMLSAEGSGGVLPDQARAAVETVGIQRLERELRN